ncbi:hypothetical protein KY349_05885 [Candidatus Woesearchaeota archaeon]|nr:hypothetical protein [Candidatus Woesearchaeota archaeon]
MPLLGIGKKKEEGQQPAQQQEVPDELPDLPQKAENAPEQASDAQQGAPDELPPAEAPVGEAAGTELAPDELPPVADADTTSEVAQGLDDRRLYFSNLLRKLHEEGVKSTKLTAPSVNLLSDMKKHWKTQKRSEEIDAMNKKVEQCITPLQRLEQEWIAIHDEIESKKTLLHEKEDEIKNLAENLKQTAAKAEKMGLKPK